MNQREKVTNYVREQIAQAENRVRAYIFDADNQPRPERSVVLKLANYVSEFSAGAAAARWILLTGLRGAGKTTAVSQVFFRHKNADGYKLFLSLDQVTKILGSSLHEVLEIYEQLLGMAFEQLDRPLYLFLDEIHYDKQWGAVLKSLYDRSHKIFVLATGSAALLLNTNADVARRAVFEKLFPLNFTEYLKIKTGRGEAKGLGRRLRAALFDSATAAATIRALRLLAPDIKKYWLGVEHMEIERYLKYGSLPFMIALKNEALIYDQVSQTLDRIINSDVADYGRFASEILAKIPALLYVVADTAELSFKKLAEISDISRPKITEIFKILEHTETVLRVYPHGSHINQVKKPSKYLFAAPAFRAMYYNLTGNVIAHEQYRGKLLEDAVGMYLHRILYKRVNVSLTYDSAQGGADFIVGWGKEKIIIEVGAGDKGARQIKNTMGKVKVKYGFTVSRNELNLIGGENILQVPLEYFLLL